MKINTLQNHLEKMTKALQAPKLTGDSLKREVNKTFVILELVKNELAAGRRLLEEAIASNEK